VNLPKLTLTLLAYQEELKKLILLLMVAFISTPIVKLFQVEKILVISTLLVDYMAQLGTTMLNSVNVLQHLRQVKLFARMAMIH
jgi:hypothetical protein